MDPFKRLMLSCNYENAFHSWRSTCSEAQLFTHFIHSLYSFERTSSNIKQAPAVGTPAAAPPGCAGEAVDVAVVNYSCICGCIYDTMDTDMDKVAVLWLLFTALLTVVKEASFSHTRFFCQTWQMCYYTSGVQEYSSSQYNAHVLI